MPHGPGHLGRSLDRSTSPEPGPTAESQDDGPVLPSDGGRDEAGHVGIDGPRGYQVKLNLNTKVLDFVQFGGPKLTVGRTVFEMLLKL